MKNDEGASLSRAVPAAYADPRATDEYPVSDMSLWCPDPCEVALYSWAVLGPPEVEGNGATSPPSKW